MGIASVRIKILPESLEVKLEKLKQEVQAKVEENKGKKCQFEEEPIAFGLKALIVQFAWPEEIELETLEEELRNLDGVSSVQVIDMRRAFGS